jgi:uncharacterized membrane protein
MTAPRSVDQYLKQLRAALAGEDPSLVQDALYDAEEYLRAEIAAHPQKSEADVLELIASTYGAPEEVAAAYRDTEQKVKAALKPPAPPASTRTSALGRYFGVFLDVRSYTSLFYMLLSLATGIAYFTVVVTGVSLSAGFAILIIGIPFFLLFTGITRVIALGEGRLIEALTGERMPRRPVHPGPPAPWMKRIGEMLKDARTWTTLVYLLLMLPLGIVYFTLAALGLALGIRLLLTPLMVIGVHAGWWPWGSLEFARINGVTWGETHSAAATIVYMLLGLLVVPAVLHAARGIARAHARLAKAMLVESGA